VTKPERIARGLWWDRALSLVSGCTPVSPGCDHCWAAAEAHMRAGQKNEKIRDRYAGLTEGGKWNGKVRLMEKNLELPLRVKKPQVWAVWNDLFHPDVPDEFIKEFLFRVWYYNQHTFLVLTKRPERIAGKGRCSNCGYLAPIEDDAECPTCGTTEEYMREQGFGNHKRDLPKNLWIGTTVENQEQADKRIPILLQIPAAVRFVSVEPMLGPVNLGQWLLTPGWVPTYNNPDNCNFDEPAEPTNEYIQWVICGGESGPGVRPMHPDWARSLRDQCQAAGVPYFFKQWGEYSPIFDGKTRYENVHSGAGMDEPCPMYRVGKKAAGRLLDGREHNEMPAVKP